MPAFFNKRLRNLCLHIQNASTLSDSQLVSELHTLTPVQYLRRLAIMRVLVARMYHIPNALGYVYRLKRKMVQNALQYADWRNVPVVTLPDGYNGHTAKFYSRPISSTGSGEVKLACAESGRQYLTAWKYASDLRQ